MTLGKLIFELLPNLTNGTMGPPKSQGPPSNNVPQPYGSNNVPQPYGSNTPQSYGSTGAYSSNNAPNSNPVSVEPLPVPQVPATFPELNKKSVEELTLLLSDKGAFDLFIENMEFVQNIKKLQDDVINQNQEVAKNNIAKEGELNRLRQEANGLRNQMQQLKQEYDQKAQQQQQLMNRFAPAVLLDQLRNATHQIDQESEKLAEDFLQGQVNQQQFLKQYMQKRSLYHLRNAKIESIQRMQGAQHF